MGWSVSGPLCVSVLVNWPRNWSVVAEGRVSLVVPYSNGTAKERTSQAMVPGMGSGMTNGVSLCEERVIFA